MNAVTPAQIVNQAARLPAASQATNIEAARAIAEVQAMFMVAKNNPRDEGTAMNRALQACSEMSVASRAFFSFPRGSESVTGESIVLATELARCWGNIDYGIMELARDDVAGHTEMLAFARDLETNTRSSQTFIVPHSRDTRGGRKPLTDMRDIYENNANNGARRLRECIFRVLPSYVKNAAADKCREVLERGEGNKPLPVRISEAISAFSSIGVNTERLAAKHGPSSGWTAVEIANLEIAYRSIKRGETTIDEAFPKAAENVSDEVRKSVASKKAAAAPEPEATKAESSIPAWLGEETRLIDAIHMAVDRQSLEDVEKDFLKIKGTFPEDAAAKMQKAIDDKFSDIALGDD